MNEPYEVVATILGIGHRVLESLLSLMAYRIVEGNARHHRWLAQRAFLRHAESQLLYSKSS